MIRRCVAAGLREPEFAVTDGFVTTVWRVHAGVHADLTDREAAMLRACIHEGATSKALQAAAEYAGRTRSFERHLKGLLRKGLLEMAVPDKPTSPAQRYLLTDKGRAVIRPDE